jgi:LCP family protein required for cell wall assembly
MRPTPPSLRRRARWPVVVIIVIVAAALVLPTAGLTALQAIFQRLQRSTAQSDPALPLLDLPAIGTWQGQERINVLLIGIDQRAGELPATARADMLMLLTLDPIARTAGLLSIPRDLYVPLPDRGQDRINVAHAYGGPTYVMRTVEYNFGVPVRFYIRLNFAAAMRLIDLAGGVEIYNERDIDDPAFPDAAYGYDPFRLPVGWHWLDGRSALKYVRTRHGGSDFDRLRRQQQVVMALREALRSNQTLVALLPQLPQILQALGSAVETNLSTIEIAQLALLAREIPDERIARVAIDESATQTWTTPQGGNVLIPIGERVRELRAQFYAPQPQAAQTTGAPLRVAIQNGTLRTGLAAGTKAYLEARGVLVLSIGDAPQRYARSAIVDYKGQPDRTRWLAAELSLSLTSIAVAPDPTNTLDVLIILGDDFQPR